MLGVLDAASQPWRIAFCSPSLSGLRAAVDAGLGLTCLARSTVPEGVRVLQDEPALPPLGEVSVGLHRGQAPLSKAALKLEEFLAASFDAVHRQQWPAAAYDSISRKNVRVAAAVG
jgi:DNA-binding transcriptional LysR family regulator